MITIASGILLAAVIVAWFPSVLRLVGMLLLLVIGAAVILSTALFPGLAPASGPPSDGAIYLQLGFPLAMLAALFAAGFIQASRAPPRPKFFVKAPSPYRAAR